MGLGLYRNNRNQPITPWEGSWAATVNEESPLKVPARRPFTRTPIKPVERHRDDKNDYRRAPKHRNKGEDFDSDE